MTTTKPTRRYREVCAALGMDPDIQFVRLLPGGSIGFTIGKPEEIRLLYRRCLAAGLKPSAGLAEMAGR